MLGLEARLDDRLYHYVICRADIPTGFAMAQVVHAAGSSVVETPPKGTYAVVLAVPDIRGLLDVRDALECSEIPHRLICEPDAPWNNAPTCIGLVPTRDRRKIRKVLGRLPLLK